MGIDPKVLQELIERELEHLADERVLAHVRTLLVEPHVELRDWDYGDPGQNFPCWNVLSHTHSNTGIAYCEYCFGPRMPWGLVWLGNADGPDSSMGMDWGWFPTFLDAYFDSPCATELPIWRVMKDGLCGDGEFVTDEGSWEETWIRVEAFRASDPASRYDCYHSIAFKTERF